MTLLCGFNWHEEGANADKLAVRLSAAHGNAAREGDIEVKSDCHLNLQPFLPFQSRV